MSFEPVGGAITHVAVLGNALPRRCGLATYTSHSVGALRASNTGLVVDHYAMDDGHGVAYGPDVIGTISADDEPAYVRAATLINRSGAQLLWLHHEFGIFGGQAGDHVLSLLRHLAMPIVATLHTVLAEPDDSHRRVMTALIGLSSRLIVMAHEAASLLVEVYGADADRIDVIAHGAPDRPLAQTNAMKAQLALPSGPIVMTFGLLSPGKGIETAIRALPDVIQRHGDVQYLVVGATHPALVRSEGERYRQNLAQLARTLGVEAHIRFIDRFLEDDDLLDFLQAADIYLTPYLGREQVTSGTLSYALAMGRPIVSTPYIHAEEVLVDGVGTLVPFDDADAISSALLDLLETPDRLEIQASRAWKAARSTIWPENARRVLKAFGLARAHRPFTLPDRHNLVDESRVLLGGVAAMTDDVGIMQHSIHGIPDRHHGYCIDDAARALKLCCETRAGDPAERYRLAVIYAAFVQHAWNDEIGRFRNFMRYDRQWLEEAGSEDSNGRTLWTLGQVMRTAPQDNLKQWANGLFNQALPLVEAMQSPRAIAFSMLGMVAVLSEEPGHVLCRDLLLQSVDMLQHQLAAARRPGWLWFESVLAYDNARLPQALIEAGCMLRNSAATNAGLASLRWLLSKQTAPIGHFRPIGSGSFHRPYAEPNMFDQQPLEAAATIDACASAFQADNDLSWVEEAQNAFAWFSGRNDLALPLSSVDGTLCYDGLTPKGVNLNQGAESILALQMARHSLAQLMGDSDLLPQLALVH